MPLSLYPLHQTHSEAGFARLGTPRSLRYSNIWRCESRHALAANAGTWLPITDRKVLSEGVRWISALSTLTYNDNKQPFHMAHLVIPASKFKYAFRTTTIQSDCRKTSIYIKVLCFHASAQLDAQCSTARSCIEDYHPTQVTGTTPNTD